MVITSNILQSQLGIDGEIADYFANNRPIPKNNLFWGTKRIYISAGFGFLTIPLSLDLMHKLGISKDLLLNDEHVTRMEEGFDKLKRYENKEYTLKQFTHACKQILEGNIKQKHLAADLFNVFSGKQPEYFKFEQTYKSLARSDSFLFTLVDLDITDEWVRKFLPYWYSLARPILLLDDFKDLEEDRRDGDDNIIIELGNNAEAVDKAFQLGVADLELLAKINPKLSKFINSFLKEALMNEYIRKELA